MTQATLSFNMTGREICIEHNNRKIPVPHSDVLRESDNYYWSGNKSLEQTYSELFANDVAEFNSKQKRNYLPSAQQRQNISTPNQNDFLMPHS